MNVLHLVAAPGVPVCGPSGASHHVRDLAEGLVQAGHDVHLFGARAVDRRGDHGAPNVPFTETGVAGWPSWLKRWEHQREIRTSRRLARKAIEHALASETPVDLVVERHTLFSDAAWKVGDRLGVPWVLEVNAPHILERTRFESAPHMSALRWERDVLRAAPCIVAVSQWLVRWLVDEVGCSPDRVFHLPNGVRPEVGEREHTRAALGIAPGTPLLGFIGSLRPWHGVDRLPALLESWPSAHLLLVGADQQGKTPDWVTKYGERVHAVGRVDGGDVANFAAAMDVGLAPYPIDAPPWFSPLKISAYRAQGTPVVATDIGDNALEVGDGGVVVPPDDDTALLNACREQANVRRQPFRRLWRDVADNLVSLAVGSTNDGR